MKKIFILMIPILFLTGCTMELMDVNGESSVHYIQDDKYFYLYVDKDTCVQYIYDVSDGGVFMPRLNKDGSLLLNEECLKEQQ